MSKQLGTVASFNVKEGVGFITPTSSPRKGRTHAHSEPGDIVTIRIIHREGIDVSGIADLFEHDGDRVEVYVHNQPKCEPDDRPRAPLPDHPDDIARVTVVPLSPQLVRL